MDSNVEDRSSLESMSEYLKVIWRWAWFLILAAIITGIAAYFITERQPSVYQAKTLVMVNGASGSSYDSYMSIYSGTQLATTYAQTMTTQPILSEVENRLGIPVSSANIAVRQIENTQLITISVEDTDYNNAAAIANTLVTIFAEQVFTDQTSRYADLKAGLEKELNSLDELINSVNVKLAALEAKTSGISEASQADYLKRTELEATLAQYQQSRAYLFSNYQSIKLSEAQSTSSIIQKDPAVPDPRPIRPQPMRSAFLAGLIGLALAAVGIFLIAFLQDEIRDPDEITRKWGLPVLGVILNYGSHQENIITISQPRSPISESFRSLRTNIQFSGVEKKLHTLLVTSASPSDGKTSVAANVAAVFAQGDCNVIVMDCDLRKPRIHKAFQVSNRIGLSDFFIRSDDRLDGVYKKTENNHIGVITSGSLPPNPSELLGSTRMNEVLRIVEKECDLLIMDTPPLLAVTDALVLANRVDGVILVMDPKKTKRAAIKHAIDQIRRVNANLLGIVLNNVNSKNTHTYYTKNYYYDRQHGYGVEKQDSRTELFAKKASKKNTFHEGDSGADGK